VSGARLGRAIRSAVLTAGAAAALAGGAGTLRAQATDIPRLQLERYVLPNGLEVVLHEDHTVPMVAVSTYYHVGSADEQRGRTGFAHLFEHIMFMGSEHVPVGKFDQWLEAAGANNNGYTTNDRTNYYEWMPSNALPLALWLDADRMGWLLPTMDLPKVNLQRDVVKNERRESYDNQPYGRAGETILAALYPPDHPYSWPVIGSMTDLSAATLDDVRGFFRTYYAPNNATLVVAGDFRPDSAKQWITRYFGDIPRGPAIPPRPHVPAVTVPRDTFLVLEDHVQLPRVFYAWHSVKAFHPDDAALNLLAYILAGDKASRLYRGLVYDRQVAQDVDADQEGNRLDGQFDIDVTPKPSIAPERVDTLVRAAIRRIADSGVTALELQRAKNVHHAGMLDRLASVSQQADLLNYYDWFAGNPDYIEEDAERYARLTTADLQRVARTYLGAHKVVLTVVPIGHPELEVRGAPIQ
jgi:zinc protease